jgi:polysaccharide biosynthesis/export protein
LKFIIFALAILASPPLSGCASDKFDSSLLRTELPPADQSGVALVPQQEYRIGPLDKLSISVFQMNDLSMEKVQVDANGRLLMPLIGAVDAKGKTTADLSEIIADKLTKYLQNPQVSVLLDESISQRITVTGAVMNSDVYQIRGRTTLMQAITMAKGPDRTTANLKRVAVYRIADGQRIGALFNVEDIRAGRAPDPEVFGGDTIIVDSSNTRTTWRAVIQSVPFFGVFAAF